MEHELQSEITEAGYLPGPSESIVAVQADDQSTTQDVERILASLGRQVRWQRLSSVGAVVTAVPLALLFAASWLAPRSPLVWRLLDPIERVMPFMRSVQVIPASSLPPELALHLHGAAPSIAIHYNIFPTLGLAVLFIALLLAMRVLRRKASRTLARFDDARTIGALAEALQLGELGLHAQASAALIRLLPKMKPSDADILTARQRDSLHRAMSGSDSKLTTALLDAFGTVGDVRDLKAVEKVAASRSRGPAWDEVRKAAERCLSLLRARAANKRAADTLVRAASDVSTASESLLRAAPTGGARSDDSLLRASSQASEH